MAVIGFAIGWGPRVIMVLNARHVKYAMLTNVFCNTQTHYPLNVWRFRKSCSLQIKRCSFEIDQVQACGKSRRGEVSTEDE